MIRLSLIVSKILEYAVGVLFLTLAAITFAQVFFRYLLKNPLTWAHEVDIILMVWAVWLGAAVGIYRKAHLRITLLSERFSKEVQRVLALSIDLLVLIFLITVGIKGIGVVRSMEGMTFTSVDLPRGLMFAAAPVGAALMAFLLIPAVTQDVRDLIMSRRRE
jgi:TRAP-type C4-dicarboxylate transport system permease small subunit